MSGKAASHPPPHIVDVRGCDWLIAGTDLSPGLARLGFARSGRDGILERRDGPDPTGVEAAVLLGALADLGVAVSEGHGWSPAEIARDLRRRGNPIGNLRCIGWRGPEAWFLGKP